MRAPIKKPKPFEWQLYGVVLLAGILLALLTPWKHTPILIAIGIGGLAGTGIREGRYNNLTPEKQREQDRIDRDERNQMIRGRAAWITLQIEGGVVLAFVFLRLWLTDSRELTEPIVWFVLCQVLVFEIVQWRLEKKY